MKNYPRIHSLTTLGIIHHQEFFYKIHPLRTDFNGDSGMGKSLIGDLIQLIIVGHSAYNSATTGNDSRDIKDIVHRESGGGIGLAYALMNIEMYEDQFVAIGCQISSTINEITPFIIHRGYDPANLELLNNGLKPEHLGNEKEIPNLNELTTHLEEEYELQLHKFGKHSKYLKILADNNILPGQYYSFTKNIKQYAKILQSFSRAKSLDVTNSDSLQKFLFGTEEIEKVKEAYKKAKDSYIKELDTSARSDEIIEDISAKLIDFTELSKFEKSLRAIRHKYLLNRVAFKEQELDKLDRELLAEKIKVAHANEYIQHIHQWAEYQKAEIAESEKRLKATKEIAEDKLKEIEPKYQELSVAQKLLEDLSCSIGELEGLFHEHKTSEIITEISHKLQKEGLLAYFKDNSWPEGYSEYKELVFSKTQHLKKELEELDALAKLNNPTLPGSLIYWAIESRTFFNHKEESILIHFQRNPLTKKENKKEYISDPQKLIGLAANAEPGEGGFWIDLSGLKRYIALVPNRVFNKPKEEIKDSFARVLVDLKKNIDSKNEEQAKLEALSVFFDNTDNVIENYKVFNSNYNISISPPNKQILEHTLEDIKNFIDILNNQTEIQRSYKEAKSLNDEAQKKFYSIGGSINAFQKIIDDSAPETLLTVDLSSELKLLLKDHPYVLGNFKLGKENDYIVAVTTKKNILINNQISLKNHQLIQLKDEYQSAEDAYRKLYSKDPDLKMLLNGNILLENPEKTLKPALDQAESAYDLKYANMAGKYADNISNRLKVDKDFIELANQILPTTFKKDDLDKNNLVEELSYYLNNIQKKSRELSERKIQEIVTVLQQVERLVSDQITTIKNIDTFFRESEQDITGGFRSKLQHTLSKQYPPSWIGDFSTKLAESVGGLFNTSDSIRNKLSQENKLDTMILEAFRVFSKPDVLPDLTVDHLLNPFTYYTVKFSMKSKGGKHNVGSTGQTYAALASLCIGKMAKAENPKKGKPDRGIRIIPIDEAEGLGSNLDVLYDIAQRHDYQIIVMSINLAGNFNEGNQYLYILEQVEGRDDRVNYTPMAIYTEETYKEFGKYDPQ